MNQTEDIQKSLASLNEHITNLYKQMTHIENQLEQVIEGARFQLSELKRHNDLIEAMKQEIKTQGESISFLKQNVSS
jgi:prefoldin subunit 5